MSKLPPIPEGVPASGTVFKKLDKRFVSAYELIGKGIINIEIEKIIEVDGMQYETRRKGDTEFVQIIYPKGWPRPIAMTKAMAKSGVLLFGTVDPEEWVGKKAGITSVMTNSKNPDMKYGIRFTKPTN